MCGITGTVNWGDSETLERMTRIQAHRGPDDSGVWTRHLPDGGFLGLGSRRLAIIDLSPKGHMPMANERGDVWITYNGEIYNFQDLRRELAAKGRQFRSNTDTEVLLGLYEEKGAECLNRLNGMFAFAIFDLRHNPPKLFLARDHFGIKPLYYAHRGGRFAFASEIKSLLQLPDLEPEVDSHALHQYLTLLWVPDPGTMFEGIQKLPAGHCATLCGGKLEIRQYWDLNFPAKGTFYPAGAADLAEEIRHRFRRSVQAQMISDVPIGSFLSAGMDSSSIVAVGRPSGAECGRAGFARPRCGSSFRVNWGLLSCSYRLSPLGAGPKNTPFLTTGMAAGRGGRLTLQAVQRHGRVRQTPA